MMKENKSKLVILCVCMCILTLSIGCIFKPVDAYSDSERRPLEQFPTFNIENVLSADFMNDFESYALDQFPLRDSFRKLKAFFTYHVFQHLDNNKIIYKDGHLSKLEYPLSEAMLKNAGNVFSSIYETYLKNSDTSIYFSIVPDKNYYLLEDDYLRMDYEKLVEIMKEYTGYMEYIDVFDSLSLEDYYYSDTHWKQENLIPVSNLLKAKMNANPMESSYITNTVLSENKKPYDFYGVYVGQYALDVDGEELKYLTNDILDACEVYSYASGKPTRIEMYSMKKAIGKDGYEMFLNGSEPLLTIVNPNANTSKELVIFRDSFGSSIAPLLVDAYAKVTLIDIRYMNQSQIQNFVEFKNQDVLFLYSTILLNSSTALNAN